MQAKTKIMGILNVTPDSFSDGGSFVTAEQAVNRAQEMVSQGADIIDIGGESTRPGSNSISTEEELGRVIPVIESLKATLNDKVLISIDSYKAPVVAKALKAGATMVNSLGGFTLDKELLTLVAKHDCDIVIYHIKGKPQTMQTGEITYQDVIKEITVFFQEQLALAEQHGINKDRFILDPGIGFGKTIEHNLTIIRSINTFATLRLPVMIGVSRKSMFGTLLKSELKLSELPSANERLEASLAATAVAVLNGASYVRTHDVIETKKFLTILDNLK